MPVHTDAGGRRIRNKQSATGDHALRQGLVEQHVCHSGGKPSWIRLCPLCPRNPRRVASSQLNMCSARVLAASDPTAFAPGQALYVRDVDVSHEQARTLPPVCAKGAEINHNEKPPSERLSALASSVCQQIEVKGFSRIQGVPLRWATLARRKAAAIVALPMFRALTSLSEKGLTLRCTGKPHGCS